MNESILHRIAINRTGKPLKPFAVKRIDESNIIGANSLEIALNQTLEAPNKFNLETIPRKTVLQLVSVDLDSPFTFNVAKGEAENYIGAMRQVLSRTRKKAKRRRMRLDEFKMLIKDVQQKEDFDEITLVRSKTLNAREESVYDELMNAIKKD